MQLPLTRFSQYEVQSLYLFVSVCVFVCVCDCVSMIFVCFMLLPLNRSAFGAHAIYHYHFGVLLAKIDVVDDDAEADVVRRCLFLAKDAAVIPTLQWTTIHFFAHSALRHRCLLFEDCCQQMQIITTTIKLAPNEMISCVLF